MPTTLNSGLQLPDKGSVDWYSSMQTNYNLLDNHLENTDIHVTAEDKANWNSKQGSLSQAQLDAIAQVATNTSDIATLQSGKANASHTHSSSDITDIGDFATKQYVDNSISGLVDNAPAALDTLKELSTALNDDANFASTVTTTLATKANSADLATVATSGSYNDLSNKPTINDSTITIQKNGSTVDTFTTNGSAKTIDIPVPTKTSDLTNDSNFVDTSNSAVASGITSAKVTDYDSHIADTDIHVTTADKNRWNNQAYVFRYSSTALVASSTNSNTLLDNTDNLKVGDKVIDSSGVLFSITAIDSVNSTFTVGSALIDLALDGNVVHTSGNETIAGVKTFSNDIIRENTTIGSKIIIGNSNTPTIGSNGVGFIQNKATLTYADSTPTKDVTVTLEVQDSDYTDGKSRAFFPNSNNVTNLGKSGKRWANVYATNYYYGGSEIEFSQKFVTTDTAQTISGIKNFSSNMFIYNSDDTATTPNLYFKSSKIEISSQGNTSGDQNLAFLDKNNTLYANVKGAIQSNGSAVKIRAIAKDSSDNSVINELQMLAYTNGNKSIFPSYSNEIDLGTSSYKWKSVYATNYYYGSNNVEFSTKFVTTDTAQTISGAKTFTDNIVAKKIVSNVSQLQINAKTNADSVAIIGGDSASEGGGIWIYGKNNTSNKSRVTLQVYDTDNSAYHAVRLNMDGSLTPTVSNNGLGSSSYKWVSFNGLTPSSLSLPDFSNRVDITSYISSLSGSTNNYTPSVNGWLYIGSNDASYLALFDTGSGGCGIRFSDGVVGEKYACIPCQANRTLGVRITCTNLAHAYFVPCLGNV